MRNACFCAETCEELDVLGCARKLLEVRDGSPGRTRRVPPSSCSGGRCHVLPRRLPPELPPRFETISRQLTTQSGPRMSGALKGQSEDRYLLLRFASHCVGRPELSMPSGPPQ